MKGIDEVLLARDEILLVVVYWACNAGAGRFTD